MSQRDLKIKNLLIVRTDRIGDVILSLPIARIVKEKYPDCRITFLVRAYTSELVKDHPYIDEFMILKENNGIPDLSSNIKMIRSKQFDAAIVVYPTFKTSLIIFLSKIPVRVGTGYRWYSMLFNSKVFEHRKDARKHELEYNTALLKNIGIAETVSKDSVKFDLKPSEEAKRFIENLLNEEKIYDDKKIVIVHPGSGGSSIDLPVDKFIELVKSLSAKPEIQLLITGMETEKQICGNISKVSGAINLAGRLSLSQLIALISRAQLFISNSTGPIHIAAALNISTIGFYPKIQACSAKRWGPYSNKSFVFTPQIDCSNCNREQCERLNCMSSININDVIVSAEKILNLDEKNGE
ncbi:MAG: glycosyltransferase family 9 protein [Ignavibacteriales bacterium]|nr:MAG: glycosyltransferase family 9 protein [Ignavibacteriales bacterium]